MSASGTKLPIPHQTVMSEELTFQTFGLKSLCKLSQKISIRFSVN